MQLAGYLFGYWWSHSLMTEGRLLLSELLAHPQAAEPTEALAIALTCLGRLGSIQGDLHEARPLLEESLRIARDQKLNHIIIQNIENLAALQRTVGNYDLAESLQHEGLSLCQEHNEGIGVALHDLGRIAWVRGDFKEAQKLFEQSAPLMPGSTINIQWLARVTLAEGNLDDALILINRYINPEGEPSHAVFQHWPQHYAEALEVKAHILLRQGNAELAWSLIVDSLTKFHKVGIKSSVIKAAMVSAEICLAQNRLARAVSLFGAVDAGMQTQGIRNPPWRQAEIDRNMKNLQVTLSESAFTAAWEAGRAMIWEQVVTYALDESRKKIDSL